MEVWIFRKLSLVSYIKGAVILSQNSSNERVGTCLFPDQGTCACKHLEEELKSTKADNLGLRSSLSSHEETNTLLEHNIKELRRKLNEEISTKDAEITRVNEELESKSSAIAYLTQQLHHSKVRLKRALESNAHAQGYTGNTSTHTVSSSRTTTPRICRVVRRTTSSPAPQDVSSLSNLELKSKCSPPFSPKPPSTPPTTIPPHITPPRRASNPGRRRTFPPEKDPPQEFVSTNRDPIQRYRCAPPPPDICDILQSQEREVQIITRPSPPILPPIRSDTSIMTQKTYDDSITHDAVVPSHSVECTSSHPQRHRHLILAKSQGLSSAPSTLRVLRYQTQGIEGGRVVKEEEAEGTLLVRETVNRKDQAWQQLHQQHWTD